MSAPLVILASALASPTTGGGLIVIELVRHFAASREVTLICPEFEHQAEEVQLVRRIAVGVGAGLVTVKPRRGRGTAMFSLKRLLSPDPGVSFNVSTRDTRRVVESALESRPGARCLAVGPFAFGMLPDDEARRRVHLCLIDVSGDIIETDHARLARRIDFGIERFKVQRYERAAARKAAAVGAISKADASKISTVYGREAVAWLPPLIPAKPVSRKSIEPKTVLFTTNFTYHHSRRSAEWFINEVWPMMPDGFRLWVTGKDTAARELAAICQSGRDVSYRGLLPLPELDDLYSRCAIAVNPTRSGSGVQMKLMDALSRGVPVVTSSSSNPFEKFLSAATSPEEWVRAIVSGSQSPVRFDYKSYLQDASDRWIRWLDARNWDERS